MTSVTFAFLREGPSDDGLLPHFRILLAQAGFDEVIGSSRDYRGPVLSKLTQVVEEGGSLDLVFVHRDADAADPSDRRDEIRAAAEALRLVDRFIAVVPVQELEAWLLLDAAAIRQVAGKPSGLIPLNLPPPLRVEQVPSPKEVLKEALLVASLTSGRRRRAVSQAFSTNRRVLLQRLRLDGPVRTLASWRRLEQDINEYARSRGIGSEG